jgi:hypothetical protein
MRARKWFSWSASDIPVRVALVAMVGTDSAHHVLLSLVSGICRRVQANSRARPSAPAPSFQRRSATTGKSALSIRNSTVLRQMPRFESTGSIAIERFLGELDCPGALATSLAWVES